MVKTMTKVLHSLIRGYLLDLLPLPFPRRKTDSDVVIFVSRFLGCVTVVAVAASIRHARPISASELILFGLLVMTIALLVGNLIKEVAILIGSIAINQLGLEFRRTRLTLSGAQMNELYRPDGTWHRYILATTEIIHEWSDLEGECHQEVSQSVHRGDRQRRIGT
jgi:hypothetical protein